MRLLSLLPAPHSCAICISAAAPQQVMLAQEQAHAEGEGETEMDSAAVGVGGASETLGVPAALTLTLLEPVLLPLAFGTVRVVDGVRV